MAIRRNLPPDGESSSLNEENRRFGANRRGLSAKEIIKIFGQVVLLIGVVTIAGYVILENLLRRPCDRDEFRPPPVIERNGIFELTWDSLPTAIHSISNLLILEQNSRCAPLNVSTLQSLRCDYLSLAVMPHATFNFRRTCGKEESIERAPCFGVRWIANQIDSFHGPFGDLDELKAWFASVTSDEYAGCLGRPRPPPRSAAPAPTNSTL